MLISLVTLLPFVCGWFITKQDTIPSWLDRVGYCVVQSSDNPHECAERIAYQLEQCIKQNGALHCIIMPESTFSFPLNLYPEFITLWCKVIPKNCYLIMGSHRIEGEKLFNTLYVLYQGRIIDHYDKRHLFVFTEQLPMYWSHIPLFAKLFLSNKVEFYANLNKKSSIHLSNFCSFVPYICSDLFFAFDKDDCKKGGPLFCLVNDNWFEQEYMPNLMLLDARLKAIAYGADILYSAYWKGCLIMGNGTIYRLNKGDN